MRLKLTEWTGLTADQALSARGMERAEIEALVQHGKYERFRPLRALFELMVDFMTFCRWRRDPHEWASYWPCSLSNIPQSPEEITRSHPRMGESQRAFSSTASLRSAA